MAAEYILYEDEELVVIHKPAGLPSQTKRLGQKDAASLLKNYLAEKGETPYAAFINRLDQPVEGILLAAKTKDAAASLSAQLARHEIEKYYRAVVFCGNGRPLTEGMEEELADYLKKDGKTNMSFVVKKEESGAKRAVLQYRVLRVKDDLAELSIRLMTGRHHQIRVQMAHAGLPIEGDRKYGRCGEGNIALCAAGLSFCHPKTGKKIEVGTEPKHPLFQLLRGSVPV